MTTDGGDITLEIDIAQPGWFAVTATNGDITIDTDGGTTTLDDERNNGATQPEDRNAWTIVPTSVPYVPLVPQRTGRALFRARCPRPKPTKVDTIQAASVKNSSWLE